MKKIILMASAISALLGTEIQYKENGVLKNINTSEKDGKHIIEDNYSYTTFLSEEAKIVVKFKDGTLSETINSIEADNDLQFQGALSSGSFIYIVQNGYIVDSLKNLSSDNNVITAKPIINKTVKFH
jgi:signal transduction protein with GAF and PtsI domain